MKVHKKMVVLAMICLTLITCAICVHSLFLHEQHLGAFGKVSKGFLSPEDGNELLETEEGIEVAIKQLKGAVFLLHVYIQQCFYV